MVGSAAQMRAIAVTPRLILAALAVGVGACGAPEPQPSTGGTKLPPGSCGRGVLVVGATEAYQSSNVSLLGLAGDVMSSSFISSATQSGALSAPLSGDVVAPSTPFTGEEVVLIDRFLTSVLTWVRVTDGAVTGQLSVKTGFASNPQDYLELPDGRAYVSRFEPNSKPGQVPFDAGDDVVILSPERKLVGRIDLTQAMVGAGDGFFARPSKLVLQGGSVWVLLQGHSAKFDKSAPSRLVALDPSSDAVENVIVLDELRGCDALAPSPSGTHLAVSCSGEWRGSDDPDPSSSGVAIVDTSTRTLHQVLPAASLTSSPLAKGIGFLDEGRLLVTTLGAVDGATAAQTRADTLLDVRWETGESVELLASQNTAFSFGAVRCFAACGLCFLADADRGVVHRFEVTGDGALTRTAVAVDGGLGTPPRDLGSF